MPHLEAKTKYWSWHIAMDLDDDDNSGFLYWDDDDLGRKLLNCGQGDQKSCVKDVSALSKMPNHTQDSVGWWENLVGGSEQSCANRSFGRVANCWDSYP